MLKIFKKKEDQTNIFNKIRLQTFGSQDSMLVNLWTGHDLYNYLTGQYLFEYNEAGDIACYTLSNKEAIQCSKTISDTGEQYWGAALGPGGYIYSASNTSELISDIYDQPGWMFTEDIDKAVMSYA